MRQLSEQLLGSRDEMLSLCLITSSFMAQTLCTDAGYLAMMEACELSRIAGVPPKTFERVANVLTAHWAARRKQNPLSGMF